MRAPWAIVVLAGAVGLALNWMIGVRNHESWHVDFNQFYVASQLAGTGELYNWDLLRTMQNAYHERAVPTGRLPVFAAAFKAISFPGYSPARVLWLVVCTASAVWSCMVWPDINRQVLLLLACWSMPLFMSLAFGQDTAVVLAIFTAGLLLLSKKKDFTAGLVFSCMLVKFHLTAGVIVLVLTRKRWRAVGGGALGTALLLLLSFAVEGVGWPSRWLAISQLPLFDPAQERMPNLRGLLHALPGSALLYCAAILFVLYLAIPVVRRAPLAHASAVALAFGLLVAPHGYAYDLVLLLPLAAYSAVMTARPLLSAAAILFATPAACILLLGSVPAIGQIFIVGFACAAIMAMSNASRPLLTPAVSQGDAMTAQSVTTGHQVPPEQ